MRLKLDLEGISFEFEVLYYEPSTEKEWGSNWAKTSLKCSSGTWLNYVCKSQEIFLCWEIEKILNKLEALLQDNIVKKEELGFIEPDITLILSPRQKRRNSSSAADAPSDYLADIDMEWQISFWNEGLTANYLSLAFDREEIRHLCHYLKLVVGRASNEDPEVQMMIKNGLLS